MQPQPPPGGEQCAAPARDQLRGDARCWRYDLRDTTSGHGDGTSLLLGVPFHTQIDGTPYSLVNCGPASLSMVLTAFGLDADPAAIRDYLNYLVGNYDTEEGTSLYTLARIAARPG